MFIHETIQRSSDKHRFEFSKLWTPAQFLFTGGVTLVFLGSTGVMGVLGSISSAGLFHPPYWISWVHLSVGITNLAIVAKGSGRLQRAITFVPAVLATALGLPALVFSVFGLGGPTGPAASELADPSDPLAHLCVGTMALLALWNTRPRTRRAVPNNPGYLDR